MATPSDDNSGSNNNGAPPPGGTGAPGGGDGQQPAARPTTADLPPDVLKVRLDAEAERAARREREQLFAKYNVKSEDELAAKLQRLGTLEETDKKRTAEDEERKRASMSSEERLKAENDQLKARVQELEGQLAASNGKLSAVRHGQLVRAQAAELVDPDMLDAAELKLAAHIKDLRERGEQAKIVEFEKPAKVREYFRDLVARQPKFAKAPPTAGAGAAGAAGGKLPATRKPITTGASPARATPPGKVVPAPTSGKTLRPGQKNSMNDKEAAEHLQKTMPGVRIPGMAS